MARLALPFLVNSCHVAGSCNSVLSQDMARSEDLALSRLQARSCYAVLSSCAARSLPPVLSFTSARSACTVLSGIPAITKVLLLRSRFLDCLAVRRRRFGDDLPVDKHRVADLGYRLLPDGNM